VGAGPRQLQWRHPRYEEEVVGRRRRPLDLQLLQRGHSMRPQTVYGL